MSGKLINAYCDESCHLQSDGSNVMVLGTVYCPAEDVKRISEKVKTLKASFNLSTNLEIKWSKVSYSKKEFYRKLIEYFFSEPVLQYRCVAVKNKDKLDHDRFSQSHDEFYYKIYYTLLVRIINPNKTYHFYLDIKDTNGGKKTKRLQEYLANTLYDFNHECVARVQQIRSCESEILQLCDLLTGAMAYANRFLDQNRGKIEIIHTIKNYLPQHSLTVSTKFHDRKFNFLVWEPQE